MSSELIINSRPYETRVALVENGVVVELHIERDSGRELMGNIYRGRVVRVLPGMQGAQLSMSHEQADCCCEGHECPTAQLGAKSRPDVAPQRKLVTLRKEARDAYYVHPVYARLTLDEKGDVVKMVVSR